MYLLLLPWILKLIVDMVNDSTPLITSINNKNSPKSRWKGEDKKHCLQSRFTCWSVSWQNSVDVGIKLVCIVFAEYYSAGFGQKNNRNCKKKKLIVKQNLNFGLCLTGRYAYEKSCYSCKTFCVHSYSSQDAKVDQGVQFFFWFPTNIVKQSYKKVFYKIIFINNQFIMKNL